MLDEYRPTDSRTLGEGTGDLVGMLSDIAVAVLFGLLVAVLQTWGGNADQNSADQHCPDQDNCVALEDQKKRFVVQSVHHYADPYDRPFTPYNEWETLLSRPHGPNPK